MTTVACFCGGLIEGLVFLAWAGFAWVTGVFFATSLETAFTALWPRVLCAPQ